MQTSVLIPTYNSARTIEATLEAVFAQTVLPDEVLIMDDGSTDNTVAVLNSFGRRVTVLQQANGGVARARNALAQRAQGELLAFLDHDDIWHPQYLEAQTTMFRKHPEAVGFFTRQKNHLGFGPVAWSAEELASWNSAEVIPGLEFFRLYHKACGQFASMSFCCIPKSVMGRLGPEPFHPELSGVDDGYIFHTLMLRGSIVYNARELVAYRITPGAQSASLLKSLQKAVRSLELLEPQFAGHPDPRIPRAFNAAFAAQRREYGRVLMGTGQPGPARQQFRRSLRHCRHPVSLSKSLVWLFMTGFPKRLQPKWPGEWKRSHAT